MLQFRGVLLISGEMWHLTRATVPFWLESEFSVPRHFLSWLSPTDLLPTLNKRVKKLAVSRAINPADFKLRITVCKCGVKVCTVYFGLTKHLFPSTDWVVYILMCIVMGSKGPAIHSTQANNFYGLYSHSILISSVIQCSNSCEYWRHSLLCPSRAH